MTLVRAHTFGPLVLGILALTGCSTEVASPPATHYATASQRLISDALHNGGTQGFFFLPPMVPAPPAFGDFVPTANPVVVIDELAVDGRTLRTVATFTTTSGPAGEGIRVHRQDSEAEDGDTDPKGYFVARWNTDDEHLSLSATYRIRVSVDGRSLGFADVDVVRDAKQAKSVNTNEFVPLVDGRTLRIKFRIDRAALGVDSDGDGVLDGVDNCPSVANADQRDSIGTGVGDACRCEGVTCQALDACHRSGICDGATGKCSNPSAPNGSSCDDGNACTRVDACVDGTCVGADPVACSDVDQCHAAGVCNPVSGACDAAPLADGTSCNDGNACTQIDTCQSGTCLGSNPVVCDAVDACHLAGTCDPTTGACSNPTAADGSTCDDGNACTVGDVCVAGGCTAGTPLTCVASNECREADSCAPASGSCSEHDRPDGTPCSIGLCRSGVCEDVRNALIGYWPLDGDGSDRSGHGLHLVAMGAPGFSSGLVGGALQLHGDGSQYLVRPQDDDVLDFGSNDFTVQAWVKFNQLITEQNFFEKFSGSGGPGWTFTKLLSAQPHFYAQPAVAVVGSPVTAGQWHHFVMRRQGSAFALWVDGALAVSASGTAAVPDTTAPLLVGRRNAGDPRNFAVDGQIDELVIWQRAVSDAEIGFFYNNGHGRAVPGL